MKSAVGLSLNYVVLYVKDLDVSVQFYRERLGLELRSRHDGWVELGTGATTLALYSRRQSIQVPARPPCKLIFRAHDVHAAYETLKGAGVEFETDLEVICAGPDELDGIGADFRDPDGHLLSIFGAAPRPD